MKNVKIVVFVPSTHSKKFWKLLGKVEGESSETILIVVSQMKV